MLDTTPETLRDHTTSLPAQRTPNEARLRRLNAQAALRDWETPISAYRNLIAAAGHRAILDIHAALNRDHRGAPLFSADDLTLGGAVDAAVSIATWFCDADPNLKIDPEELARRIWRFCHQHRQKSPAAFKAVLADTRGLLTIVAG